MMIVVDECEEVVGMLSKGNRSFQRKLAPLPL
jgi:hypothetical protein